jgi:hypothetical protein
MPKYNINDAVDALHIDLWESAEHYQRYLYATTNAEAVEGSMEADTFMAAQLIRDRAREIALAPCDEPVRDETLASIAKALNVVLRRFAMDRKTRRGIA